MFKGAYPLRFFLSIYFTITQTTKKAREERGFVCLDAMLCPEIQPTEHKKTGEAQPLLFSLI